MSRTPQIKFTTSTRNLPMFYAERPELPKETFWYHLGEHWKTWNETSPGYGDYTK
jgi:hypothetical protein